MIQLIGKNIQIQEIKSTLFSIICDETMDITRIEQFSLRMRSITLDLGVKERFLGFWHAKGTDGESL